MVKAKKKMGAGRTEATGSAATAFTGQWSPVGDKKQKVKQLKEMAKKLVPEPQRKAFIAQGIQAIEREEAEARMSETVKVLYADLQPVLDKHGVTGAHILVKVPIDAKAKQMGIKGWALSSNVSAIDGLEMMGVLSQSLIKLSNSNFRGVKV